MKLYELMHETQPPRVLNANALRWKVDGGLLGWIENLLSHLVGKTDHDRKA
jgi:hypothetical protein